MNINIFYEYTHKFPLIVIQNRDHSRCLDYKLACSTSEDNEIINNRFEYLGGKGADDLEVSRVRGWGQKSMISGRTYFLNGLLQPRRRGGQRGACAPPAFQLGEQGEQKCPF